MFEALEGGRDLRLDGMKIACRRGDRILFDGIDFSVSAGEVLALAGPNGVGKSSLLRIVAGLLSPAAGKISFHGSAGEGRLTDILLYIGHQDAIKAALTVRDDLAFWTRYFGGRGSVEEALEAVGLFSQAQLPCGVLSAGQRRRLALARLISVRRPVWILDEPTAALDSQSEAMLARLITDHTERGGLVLAATHHPLPVPETATLHLEARRPA